MSAVTPGDRDPTWKASTLPGAPDTIMLQVELADSGGWGGPTVSQIAGTDAAYVLKNAALSRPDIGNLKVVQVLEDSKLPCPDICSLPLAHSHEYHPDVYMEDLIPTSSDAHRTHTKTLISRQAWKLWCNQRNTPLPDKIAGRHTRYFQPTQNEARLNMVHTAQKGTKSTVRDTESAHQPEPLTGDGQTRSTRSALVWGCSTLPYRNKTAGLLSGKGAPPAAKACP